VSDNLLALDGAVYLIHEDFEWSEDGSVLVDLGEVPSRLADPSDCSTWNLLSGTRLHLLFL